MFRHATGRDSGELNSHGVAIGGAQSYMSELLEALRSLDPSYLVIAKDGPTSNEGRRNIDPAYKTHRPPKPIEVRRQLALCYQCCELLGAVVLDHAGWEADDVIASLIERYEGPDVRTTIAGRDKDLHQLLSPDVDMYSPQYGEWATVSTAEAKWGVPVKAIPEMQALAGDSVDRIAGPRDIGLARAKTLIKRYGTAAAARDHREELSPHLAGSLADFDPVTALSLVTLRRDLELPVDEDQIAWDPPTTETIRTVFRSLQSLRRAPAVG